MNHAPHSTKNLKPNTSAAGYSKGRGKSALKRKLVAMAVALAFTPALYAVPLGGQVTSGSGSIGQAGTTTTITQSSQNLSLNWQSFNIGSSETVNFLQPSSSAVAVNRIFDTSGTQILGHLNANGQVYLINPNGILFGQGSQVNVGGLVASTLNVSDAGIGGTTQSFTGSGTGSVTNQGTINATNGGYVALLGNTVNNQGTITATRGAVALGAGSAVTLTFAGNSLVHLQVDQSTLNNLAANGGLIQADGGMVVMTAGAKDSLLASVVNNTGIIEARTVQNVGGTITLLGGMSAGSVNVGGTLDASAQTTGSGGFIETSASHVQVANDAHITTASSNGLTGTWLIDPQNYTVAASGGDITGAALSANLGTTNITLQSSSGATAGSGNVNVNDAVTWSANNILTLTASNNVNVNASITASGATAGIAINPNTANGLDAASGTGVFNLGSGAAINLPNVSASSATALVIGGASYTVINSLGAAGSTTALDLQGMSGNLSGHYALGSNIDATATTTWSAGAGFAPIGNSTTAYTGTFDGLGHTISNLTINLPTTTNTVGLFGYTGTGSLIQNVGLAGGSVSGRNYVGALVGWNAGAISNSYATGRVSGTGAVGGLVGINIGSATASISNSYATGNVSGSNYVGGLVGQNWSSGGTPTISNSYATGTVTGTGNQVGGLLGINNFGAVSNSYATGSVSGASYVGGLVGESNRSSIGTSYATGSVTGAGNSVGGLVGVAFYGSVSNSYATGVVSNNGGSTGGLEGGNCSATINNSYATGSVSGTSNVGGLVGYNSGTVSNSYATGSVSGSSLVGGLVGWNNTGSVSTSYWDTVTSGQSVGIGGGTSLTGATGLTTAAMQNSASFTGWTFTTTPGGAGWVIVNGNGSLNGTAGGGTLPMLASEYSTNITNAHQLQLLAMNLSASYTLGGNINAAATSGSDVWAGSSFVPVGTAGSAYTGLVAVAPSASNFTGSFDGAGHTISNLTINRPTTDFVGLFGFAGPTATIKNVGMVGGSVTGGFYSGGLVGNNYAAISNSYSTGAVNGSTYVGGLVGGNYGSISNSHATGNVHGSGARTIGQGGFGYGSEAGGLAGWNGGGGTITNSYATGGVTTSGNYGGGLVGVNLGGTVSNSYSTGTVAVTGSNAGGLVGFNFGGSSISTSYATGSTSGTGNVGGLVGANTGTVSASYWNADINAGLAGIGAGTTTGATGLTTALMTQQSSFVGWDFATTWTITSGVTDPLLR